MVLINPDNLTLKQAQALGRALGLLREDGRPECYELPPAPDGKGYECANCKHEGHTRYYPAGQAFMCSPVDAVDGLAKFVCHAHLPEDIVIYDPVSNMCRDKSGQNVWRET